MNAATDVWGLRLNNGTVATTPVDVHGTCRYLDNAGNDSFFVPFKKAEEWEAFLAYPPNNVTYRKCTRPFSGIDISAGLYYGLPDGPTAAVDLPYWYPGVTWPNPNSACPQTFTHKFTFECSETYGASCNKTRPHSWTHTYDFTATALDSDTNDPSWIGQSRRVSAEAQPSACSKKCTPCKATACKRCNSSGSLVNKSNGTTCSGSNSGWCLSGRCQAYFFDVCSGTKGYIACWKSPSKANSRGGSYLKKSCSSCPKGQKTGADKCTKCPNTWGSGRSGEWGHTKYFD